MERNGWGGILTEPSKFIYEQLGKDRLAGILLGGLDHTEDPVAVLTLDRRFVFCNRAWKVFHGVDPDTDLTGESLDEIANEVIDPIMREGWETILKEKRYQKKFYVPCTGSWMVVNATLMDYLDPPLMTIILMDITSSVKDSDDRVKSHFMSNPIPMFMWRREGSEMVLRDFNEAGIELTGGRICEHIGISVSEFHKDNPEIITEINRCYEEKISIRREVKLKNPAVGGAWHLDVKYVYLAPDLVMVHIDDVTNRVLAQQELEKYKEHLEDLVQKRTGQLEETNEKLRNEIDERELTEIALRESEARYRAVSELTTDYTYSGVVYEDGRMKKEWVAGAFASITGYDPEEADHVLGNLEIIHPEDRHIGLGQRQSYFSGSIKVKEFRLIRKNGSIVWVMSYGLLVERTEDGGVRVLGAVKDITERKNAEIVLERRNRELRVLKVIREIFRVEDDMTEAFSQILDLIHDETRIKKIVVLVPDQDRGGFRLLLSKNVPDDLIPPLDYIGEDDEYAALVTKTDGVVVLEDVAEDPDPDRRRVKEEMNLSRTLAMPVRVAGEVRAVFVMGIPVGMELPADKPDFFSVVGNQIGVEMERAELLKSRTEYQKQLRKLAGNLLKTNEDVRTEIAHDLHDVIGQAAAGINTEVKLFEESLPPKNIKTIEWAGHIRKELKGLIGEIRRAAYSLHPPMLEDLGLIPTLKWYINRIVEPEGFEIELSATGFDEELPSYLALSFYRIAQEALTNVVRHSEAEFIVLKVIKGFPWVIMDIRDDGKGFQTKGEDAVVEGLGITGMRERVQNMGGKFNISSSPGQGTHVRVKIPLEVDND
ncbi:MAG: PAS domain S-box protein [Candidatus Krumholzibacteria bacterium]|nr:PAS domain S-box protein [Candidatus Krumholzibacteria bacterium]